METLKKNILFNLLLIVTVVLCIASCGDELSKRGKEKNATFCIDENFKEKMSLFRVQEESVFETIHLTGSVEANPDKTVSFVSLVSGVIVKTSFSLGDYVKKGQILLEIRSPELSNMHAESIALKSQIKVAQRQLKALQEMFDEGISSERELLAAQSELNTLIANEQKIKSDLALYQASSEKGVFEIKASVSGYITEKKAVPGASVIADGEALFTISDLNDVWVMANVYASNIKNINNGMKVKMTTLSYGDEVFEGEISVISHVMDEEAKVLKARIVFENKDLKLKPGMLVDIHALKESDQRAVNVPTSTLIFSDNQNYVVVYKDDCHLEARKVSILSQNSEYTFIASGLNDQEQIISKNQLLLFEQIR